MGNILFNLYVIFIIIKKKPNRERNQLVISIAWLYEFLENTPRDEIMSE